MKINFIPRFSLSSISLEYRFILVLFLFFQSGLVYTQCNLIVNGDFESYTSCPNAQSQINYATGWDNANATAVTYPTADYFNCGYTGSYGTPGTPPSGTGYIGFNIAGNGGASGAEMVGTCVNLRAGNTYTFSFYSKGAWDVNGGSQAMYLKGTPGGTFPVASTGYCPNVSTTLLTIPKAQVFNANWTYRSYTFTSPGNFGGIIIGGVCGSTDNYLIFMDDVSLTSAVPTSYGSIATTGGTSVPCGGATKNITFSLPGSCNGPYDVTYTVNGTPTTINNISNGHTISLPISVNTTVILTSVTTASGCTTNPNSTVSFTTSSAITANAGPNRTLTCSNPSDPLNGSQTGGTGAITYSWSPATGLNNTGIAVPTTSATSTTNYTLTVSDGTGCSDTDLVTVTVNKTPPNANAGPNRTTNCTTPTASLAGSGGGTYSWNNGGGTSATPTVNPGSTTTYTLTVTGTNGCTDTDATIVTVDKAPPTANAGPNRTTNCTTPTASLAGSGGGTYSWNNGGGTSATPTVNPGSTTNYTLTVTGTNGCTDTDVTIVTVDKVTPTANAGSDATTTCTTPTASLAGSGGGTYSWNNGAGTSATPTVDPTATTTYTLTVTDPANGCTDTDAVTITVDETNPAANAGADINLDCASTSGTFTATGGGTYAWTSPNGTSAVAGFSVADTDTPGNYTVTVTAANGCTDTDVATLAIDQTDPVANAGADQTSSCAVPAVTLDGSASSGSGITYSWTGPSVTAGGATNSATADAPGTYTLTVTGSNFCTHTDQVDVLPDLNVPTADAGPDDVITCDSTSAMLDGSGSDVSGTITYSWTTGTGNITGNATDIVSTADLDGTYTITVTNSANGCVSSDQMIITQDTVTPVSIVTTGSYIIDCNNPTATFDASGSSGTGNVYTWTTLGGNIVSGGNTDAPTVDESGTYSLIVTSANGCDNLNSTDVTVTVDTISPSLMINLPDTLTCNIPQVVLDASGSQAGVTFNWTTSTGVISSGATSANPTMDSSGSYSLLITSANGCTTSGTVNVVDSETPYAYIVPSTLEGEVDLSVVFSDTSTGQGLTHYWEIGLTDSDTLTPTNYTFSEIGEHQVVLTVTDQYGCVATDTVLINALELSAITVPNIFTPNGDGSNDLFHVSGGGIKKMNARIMNRWGQLIYEWDSPFGGWDGFSSAGVEAAPGTYYYFINVDFNDGHSEEFTGSFMLKR